MSLLNCKPGYGRVATKQRKKENWSKGYYENCKEVTLMKVGICTEHKAGHWGKVAKPQFARLRSVYDLQDNLEGKINIHKRPVTDSLEAKKPCWACH